MARENSRFMTLTDVQDELGISAAISYSLVRSGDLPAIQVGPKKVWRIERTEFEEWLTVQYDKTAATLRG